MKLATSATATTSCFIMLCWSKSLLVAAQGLRVMSMTLTSPPAFAPHRYLRNLKNNNQNNYLHSNCRRPIAGLLRGSTTMTLVTSKQRDFGFHQPQDISTKYGDQGCGNFLSSARDLRHYGSIRCFSSFKDNFNSPSSSSFPSSLDMTNIYQEWTLEEDQALWKGHETDKKSIVELAVLLGRGLGGVQSRLEKLRNVNSAAYERLFVLSNQKWRDDRSSTMETGGSNNESKKKKLIPAVEVLRRIQWDHMLNSVDFFVLHYDRIKETIVESPVDAVNESIAGSQTKLVDALPEHRIVAIKYRERIVWDRQKRIDLVFSGDGKESEADEKSVGIAHVISNYDKWKKQRDEEACMVQERWNIVSNLLRQVLGLYYYDKLENLVKDLDDKIQERIDNLNRQKYDQPPSSKKNAATAISPIQKSELEYFVSQSKELFGHIREDPDQSLDPTLIPTNEYDYLDLFSQWFVVLPNVLVEVKPIILHEIKILMEELKGKRVIPSLSKRSVRNRPLPELRETDLEETFIRGSGPGGQKINKSNNCVDLLHIPTQLRVQCQDTRSLEQNRKIARKRLRENLDEYLHGRQSRKKLTEQRASKRKARAKSRSRAKYKKLEEEKQQAQHEPDEYLTQQRNSRRY